MNKLQRVVCKIFKIKQTIQVQNITFNDPKKCENVLEMSGEDFKKEIADIGIIAKPTDKVVIGTAMSIDSIRHVPLASARKVKSSLKTRTIVIEITETEWD